MSLKLVPAVAHFALPSLAVLSVALTAGCTVTVKTQTKYVAPTATLLTPAAAWVGQAVEIEDKNGSVTVQVTNDPSATNVAVAGLPFAFADNQADGNAAVTDATSTIKLDETAPNGTSPGRLYAHCSIAAQAHGSAANGTTGCDLVLTIPASIAAQGLALKVTSHNGPVTVTGVSSLTNQIIVLQADNGPVTATGITGGVKAHSDNGPVTASVTPTPGSNCEASTQVGDVSLSLPATFAADHITLTATNGAVKGDFPDVTSATTSRGAAGTGASSIVATTGLGDVLIQVQ